jgi:succinate-acetate transporter protein
MSFFWFLSHVRTVTHYGVYKAKHDHHLFNNCHQNLTNYKLFTLLMIVIISPTHAQFTSLLYTLAYMFRPHQAIIRASQITKECRLKCVSMNKILVL